MSFPEWGYSYNALYVPLSSDWQCALMPARETQQVDRGRSLSFGERKQKKKERAEQIEQDRQDFDRLFRVRIDRNEARTSSDFREYVEFIDRNLRVSGWDLLDGEGVTRVLREAARDGRIIPVISRKWCGARRIFKHYAPQRWPKQGGGPLSNAELAYGSDWLDNPAGRSGDAFGLVAKASSVTMPFDGVAGALSHGVGAGSSFVKGPVPALNDAFSALSEQGLAAVAAALGRIFSEANGFPSANPSVNSLMKSFGDEGPTALSDAQPFEQQSDLSSDCSFDIAGIPGMTGDPNSWIESGVGMKKQWRMFGPDGSAAVDIDFDSHHGQPNPHAHNWDGTLRDRGWPVSIYPR